MFKKNSEIKVLNIAQPNAHNVMYNGKNIENRSMVSYFRGTIAIYASATYGKTRFEGSEVKRDECDFGCIIGFVDIVDCIVEEEVTKNKAKWFHGPYGYVFENVRVLEKPVSVKPPKGAIVWWSLEGDKAKDCTDQIDLSLYQEVVKIAKDPRKPKPKGGVKKGKLVPSVLLSVITGIEPMSFKAAREEVIGYILQQDLLIKPEDESKIDEHKCKADDKLRALMGKDQLFISELIDIIYENLEAVNAKSDSMTPTDLLGDVIGGDEINLKDASTKLVKYLDEEELFEYVNDDDLIGYIVADEKIKKLTGKDKVLFQELSLALRKNLIAA